MRSDTLKCRSNFQSDTREDGLKIRPTYQSPGQSSWLAAAWLLLLFVFSHFGTTACHAQWIEPEDLVSPLVDGEPFELLYLNKNAENAILRIVPLKKSLPNPLPRNEMLQFEYADQSGELLQVPFSSIEQHQTFNDVLIEEANRWLAEKNYSAAFRNLLYVYDHGGKNDPQLVESLNKTLFIDGKDNFQAGRFELALSIYEDIYRQDPSFKVSGINSDLIDIVLLCYDGIIKKDFANNEYQRVQQKLSSVTEKYGAKGKPLEEKWRKAFLARGDELMAQAKKLAAAGQGREAHLASRQAEQVNPGRAEIKALQEEILKQFPLIVVGVSQPAGDADGQRLEHWGARRVGRLTTRTIIELVGLSDEGGKYSFLNGTLYQSDEIGLKYVFELNPQPATFATPPADAFLIASRLLAAATPDSNMYNEAWAKIRPTVSIIGENKVSIELSTPYVRPEALLSIPYFSNRPAPTESDDANDVKTNAASAEKQLSLTQNGVYIATETDKNISTFELNPRYTPPPDQQHPVIIEQLFPGASIAADELIKNNIDVVDRIPVADVTRLKAEPGIVVRAYVLPTVHMLVPKIRGELASDTNFRNGLSHAINRNVLVEKSICDGQEIEGCDVISGPFPLGTEEYDQISYGYDLKIRPPTFNSKLAMVLIEISLRPTPKRLEKLPSPSLVLAYPDSSTAKQASEAIARMWTDVGVTTTTRALKPGETIPPDDLWDMLYLEVTMEEPLTDASKILGQHGIAKDVSAPIEQTLRNLSYADSWRTACAALRRLHRQVSVDLSVIPLWQIKEYYAYRNTVRGVGRDLIHLYQNVDQWQIDTYGSEEQE